MPYCAPCQKYWTPSSVTADGTCRQCGTPVVSTDACPHCGADQADDPSDVKARLDAADWQPGEPVPCWRCGEALPPPERAPGEEIDDRVPWHFKLMVVALVVYLGWRFIELGAEYVW